MKDVQLFVRVDASLQWLHAPASVAEEVERDAVESAIRWQVERAALEAAQAKYDELTAQANLIPQGDSARAAASLKE